MKITKAIIPVAGWGTRMLPITKAIEKCMLPIGNRPVIDFIVQDVVQAGIKDIYFVVGEDSSQLEKYYRTNIKLNDYLRRNGKEDKLPLVAPLRNVNIHFVTQPSTGGYGTSIPVGLCDEFIDDDEAALVIMGDQFFYRTDSGSNAKTLIESVRAKRGVNAGMYGVKMPLDGIDSSIEVDDDDNFVRIIEKPARGEAPSDLQNASYYLLPKTIFSLAKTLPANPQRGEFEITDPLNVYTANGGKIHVMSASGTYLDCGTVDGWLRANNFVLNST